MTPKLTDVNDDNGKSNERKDNGNNTSIIKDIKKRIAKAMPGESGFKPVEKIDGMYVEDLSTQEIEDRYKKNPSIMKDHIMKWLEKDDLEKDTDEVVEWLMKADIPKERKEKFLKPFREADL